MGSALSRRLFVYGQKTFHLTSWLWFWRRPSSFSKPFSGLWIDQHGSPGSCPDVRLPAPAYLFAGTSNSHHQSTAPVALSKHLYPGHFKCFSARHYWPSSLTYKMRGTGEERQTYGSGSAGRYGSCYPSVEHVLDYNAGIILTRLIICALLGGPYPLKTQMSRPCVLSSASLDKHPVDNCIPSASMQTCVFSHRVG